MKKKPLLSLKMKLRFKNFAIATALLLGAFNLSAQVQTDKVRLVPTIEGDDDTEFLLSTHHTGSMNSTSGQVIQIVDNLIDQAKRGGYVEYQIKSPVGGDFLVRFLAGSARDDAKVNIGVYKTESEFWPEEGLGDTVSIKNSGDWFSNDSYYAPITIEAGIVYTLRLTFINTVIDDWICNIEGISVLELYGSTDASLSTIKINGENIDGFDSNNLAYSIPLGAGETYEQIEVTTSDENAVAIVGDPVVTGHKTSITVEVTSESGIASIYAVDVFEPILLDDEPVLAMADDIYYNNGFNVNSQVLNSTSNEDYVDYYVYSQIDGNFALNMTCANGYNPSESYFNVSTLALDNTTWTLNSLYNTRIEISYDLDGNPTWAGSGSDLNDDYKMCFSVKANEPVLVRIYAITNKINAANIYGLSFSAVSESLDAYLSDLQVGGTTIMEFDPLVTNYKIPLEIGITSVEVDATANDELASIISGIGTVEIEDTYTNVTINVQSEQGFTIPYVIEFVAPIEMENELLDISLVEELFDYNDVRLTNNSLLSWFANEGFVDYYIYSEVDKNVYARLNLTQGFGIDTVENYLNVSTFLFDEKEMWEPDYLNSYLVEETYDWNAAYAVNMDWNFSLKANQPVMLRIYGITNTFNVANIHGLSIREGSSSYIGMLPDYDDGDIPTSDNTSFEVGTIKVFGQTEAITLLSDENYVGGSVYIYDFAGKLIKRDVISSTSSSYSIGNSGLYIVKVVSKTNQVNVQKCIVK